MKAKKNIFESQWMLIGEIIALASLFVAYRKSESEFVYVCYIILILAIPFFIAGVISVTRYNKILKCGQVVQAEIQPQTFQVKADYNGTSQFEYACKYNAQYYKSTVSVKNENKQKMFDYMKQNPTIQMVLDKEHDKHIIFIKQYLKDVCNCIDGYFCPSIANYIIAILIVICAIIIVL